MAMTIEDLLRQDSEWLKGTGPNANIVMSSRSRLARNIDKVPFSNWAKEKQLGEEKVNKFLVKALEVFKKNVIGERLTAANDRDEIVITAKINKEDAPVIEWKILRAMKDAFVEVDDEFVIDLSYGNSSYPQTADNARDLLDRARQALVDEKEQRLKKKILMVDDEETAITVLERILKSLGYTNLQEVRSGEEALDAVEDAIPDLIVLDMKMPGMSGYEVIGRLKENGQTKDIPILILSGIRVETSRLKKYVRNRDIPVINKVYDRKQMERLLAYLL